MTSTSTAITILAICTFYSDDLAGRLTANGDVYDPEQLTCATKLWPLNTELKVTYMGKSVYVVVNDRCDNKTDIDLSRKAFEYICNLDLGRMQVEIEFDLDNQTEIWRKENPPN